MRLLCSDKNLETDMQLCTNRNVLVPRGGCSRALVLASRAHFWFHALSGAYAAAPASAVSAAVYALATATR